MIDQLVAAMFLELLKAAPMVILYLLRKAGLVPDDSSMEPIEKLRRAADILAVNPMHAMQRKRRDPIIPPAVDPALSGHWPDEYQRPESD